MPPTPSLNSIIVDSHLSRAEALTGIEIPPHIERSLALVTLRYWSFDGLEHEGQLVLRVDLEPEVREIFAVIYATRFPLEKMIPVVHYGWSDDLSMADNNSSAFNYRRAVGRRKWSNHAYGRAIDLNPRQNPYAKGAVVMPTGATYNPSAPGTLVDGGPVVAAFLRHGWQWGGHWTRLLDWHHFEKPERAQRIR